MNPIQTLPGSAYVPRAPVGDPPRSEHAAAFISAHADQRASRGLARIEPTFRLPVADLGPPLYLAAGRSSLARLPQAIGRQAKAREEITLGGSHGT